MLRFTDFKTVPFFNLNYTLFFFFFFFHNQEISNPSLSFILDLSHARDLTVALASFSPSHHCGAAHAHDRDQDCSSRLRSRSCLTPAISQHLTHSTPPEISSVYVRKKEEKRERKSGEKGGKKKDRWERMKRKEKEKRKWEKEREILTNELNLKHERNEFWFFNFLAFAWELRWDLREYFWFVFLIKLLANAGQLPTICFLIKHFFG